MLQINKKYLNALIFAFVCSAQAQESTTFGKPVNIQKGQCETGGAPWELSRYDNGWLLAKGPKGYYIGVNPRLLIAAACGHRIA